MARGINANISDQGWLNLQELKVAMQREAGALGIESKPYQADAIDLALRCLNIDACLLAYREELVAREATSVE